MTSDERNDSNRSSAMGDVFAADETLSELTDALCRGRLALAEVANLLPFELEALYGMACQRLDVGRNEEAAILLAAVVTFFPYSARYWRAYGIALHRLLELERALAAYDASLVLEPGHAQVECYRAEVLLYLRRNDEARVVLERLAKGDRLDLVRRSSDLLRLMQTPSWQPPESVSTQLDSGESGQPDEPGRGAKSADHDAGTAESAADHAPDSRSPAAQSRATRKKSRSADTFVLPDGRALPLADSVFARSEAALTQPLDVWESTSGRPSAATADTRALAGSRSATASAAGRVAAGAYQVLNLLDPMGDDEFSDTAVVRRRRLETRQRTGPRREDTNTAIIPRRALRSAAEPGADTSLAEPSGAGDPAMAALTTSAAQGDDAARPGRGPTPFPDKEITTTAVVRRRARMRLYDDQSGLIDLGDLHLDPAALDSLGDDSLDNEMQEPTQPVVRNKLASNPPDGSSGSAADDEDDSGEGTPDA